MQVKLNDDINVFIIGYRIQSTYFGYSLTRVDVCDLLNWVWKTKKKRGESPSVYDKYIDLPYNIRVFHNKILIGCQKISKYNLYKLSKELRQLGDPIIMPKYSWFQLLKLKFNL